MYIPFVCSFVTPLNWIEAHRALSHNIDYVPCVYKIACCGHVTLIFSWQKQAVLFYTACLTLEISVYKIFKLYFSVYYDGQNVAEEWGILPGGMRTHTDWQNVTGHIVYTVVHSSTVN